MGIMKKFKTKKSKIESKPSSAVWGVLFETPRTK